MDPQAFAQTLKADLFDEEVFVFSPRGEVRSLGAGATALDFACKGITIHHESCFNAKALMESAPPSASSWRWMAGTEHVSSKTCPGPSRRRE